MQIVMYALLFTLVIIYSMQAVTPHHWHFGLRFNPKDPPGVITTLGSYFQTRPAELRFERWNEREESEDAD